MGAGNDRNLMRDAEVSMRNAIYYHRDQELLANKSAQSVRPTANESTMVESQDASIRMIRENSAPSIDPKKNKSRRKFGYCGMIKERQRTG